MTTEESALAVLVPEADPIVGEHRSRLDSGAIVGVPAHVTVLYPFMPPALVDDEVISTLAAIVATQPGFAVSFRTDRWLGEQVATLAPEPEQPFRGLTELIAAQWPAYPPYEGVHDDVKPHLTIGDRGGVDELRAAVDAILPALPIESWVSEVTLLRGFFEPGSWRPVMSFPLGG